MEHLSGLRRRLRVSRRLLALTLLSLTQASAHNGLALQSRFRRVATHGLIRVPIERNLKILPTPASISTNVAILFTEPAGVALGPPRLHLGSLAIVQLR